MVALVLLPGMDGTGQLFSDFIAALGSELDVIAVSYPPNEALDYAQLELIARSRLPLNQPLVLLAESFSGPIAISITASAPPGLCGLILCCSFARNPRPGLAVLKFLVSMLPIRKVSLTVLSRVLFGRFSSARLCSALVAALAPVSSAALRARLRAVLTIDVTHQMREVHVPVLYLQAMEDRLVPRGAFRLISQLIPGARIAELEAPHFLLQAAPAAAARHVKAFVQEVAHEF